MHAFRRPSLPCYDLSTLSECLNRGRGLNSSASLPSKIVQNHGHSSDCLFDPASPSCSQSYVSSHVRMLYQQVAILEARSVPGSVEHSMFPVNHPISHGRKQDPRMVQMVGQEIQAEWTSNGRNIIRDRSLENYISKFALEERNVQIGPQWCRSLFRVSIKRDNAA